jgi:hypothetical protein
MVREGEAGGIGLLARLGVLHQAIRLLGRAPQVCPPDRTRPEVRYKVHHIKALSLGGDEIKAGGIGAFRRVSKWFFEDLRNRHSGSEKGRPISPSTTFAHISFVPVSDLLRSRLR